MLPKALLALLFLVPFITPLPVTAQEMTPTEADIINPVGMKESEIIKRGGIGLEIMRDVEKRSRQIDDRENELDRREERLKTLQSDILGQIAELKALQEKIDESMALRKDIKKKSLTRLAKTYAAMPPATAAAQIAQIDQRIAIMVLSAMKERAAGKILAAIPTKLASELSEGMVKRGGTY